MPRTLASAFLLTLACAAPPLRLLAAPHRRLQLGQVPHERPPLQAYWPWYSENRQGGPCCRGYPYARWPDIITYEFSHFPYAYQDVYYPPNATTFGRSSTPGLLWNAETAVGFGEYVRRFNEPEQPRPLTNLPFRAGPNGQRGPIKTFVRPNEDGKEHV